MRYSNHTPRPSVPTDQDTSLLSIRPAKCATFASASSSRKLRTIFKLKALCTQSVLCLRALWSCLSHGSYLHHICSSETHALHIAGSAGNAHYARCSMQTDISPNIDLLRQSSLSFQPHAPKGLSRYNLQTGLQAVVRALTLSH